MAQRLTPVDVVTVGVGLTGSLTALELVKTGLKVVGLERGAPRYTVPDFQSPAIHDELRFSIRKGMMQDNVKEAVTFRNTSDQTALPIRRWGSFLPGTGLGAAGTEYEQPADLVLITAFPLNNVRMLLLSGIGKPYDPKTGDGVVGRNYTYQTVGGPTVFMDESININPFMASGANGTMIDDFGGDNFDHSQLGFIGGQYIGAIMTNGRPIEFHPTPPGTPKWGLGWKQAVTRHYNHTIVIQQHGTSTASRPNYLDLDPTYKDAWGQPLLRMTFDFPDNDIRMSQYIADKAVEIGRAMGGKTVVRGGTRRPYNSTIYQSTHNCGGAVMGDDPKTSVVNRYLQCWDVHNVFSIGASAFPQNGAYNYTTTIGALTYWALDAIKNKYLNSPGPLVQA